MFEFEELGFSTGINLLNTFHIYAKIADELLECKHMILVEFYVVL